MRKQLVVAALGLLSLAMANSAHAQAAPQQEPPDCREEYVTLACGGAVSFDTERERGQRFDHLPHRISAADDAW
jgi:hypothetical protein